MGKLKWTYDVPLLNNYYTVMDVLFVLIAAGAVMGVLLTLIMGVSELYTVLRIVILTFGVLVVLSFLAMGLIMFNTVEMTFTLDEKGIGTSLGKRENKMNRIALILGIFTGKLGLMSSSMMAMSKESTFVEWKYIQKAVMDRRKKVISLSSGRRMLVRLFCEPENYDDALAYVEEMLLEVEPSYL